MSGKTWAVAALCVGVSPLAAQPEARGLISGFEGRGEAWASASQQDCWITNLDSELFECNQFEVFWDPPEAGPPQELNRIVSFPFGSPLSLSVPASQGSATASGSSNGTAFGRANGDGRIFLATIGRAQAIACDSARLFGDHGPYDKSGQGDGWSGAQSTFAVSGVSITNADGSPISEPVVVRIPIEFDTSSTIHSENTLYHEQFVRLFVSIDGLLSVSHYEDSFPNPNLGMIHESSGIYAGFSSIRFSGTHVFEHTVTSSAPFDFYVTVQAARYISAGTDYEVHAVAGETHHLAFVGAGGGSGFFDLPEGVDATSGDGIIRNNAYTPLCLNADLDRNSVLDFDDIIAFLTAFNDQEAPGDLALPIDVWNFDDVIAFLTAFGAGCP